MGFCGFYERRLGLILQNFLSTPKGKIPSCIQQSAVEIIGRGHSYFEDPFHHLGSQDISRFCCTGGVVHVTNFSEFLEQFEGLNQQFLSICSNIFWVDEDLVVESFPTFGYHHIHLESCLACCSKPKFFCSYSLYSI